MIQSTAAIRLVSIAVSICGCKKSWAAIKGTDKDLNREEEDNSPM